MPDYPTCRDCPYDDHTKRMVRCGWLTKSEWAPMDQFPPDLKFLGPHPDSIDVGEILGDKIQCPAYFENDPTVQACAEAYRAFDKGCLDTFHPNPDAALLEGVMTLSQGLDLYQRAQTRKLKNK